MEPILEQEVGEGNIDDGVAGKRHPWRGESTKVEVLLSADKGRRQVGVELLPDMVDGERPPVLRSPDQWCADRQFSPSDAAIVENLTLQECVGAAHGQAESWMHPGGCLDPFCPGRLNIPEARRSTNKSDQVGESIVKVGRIQLDQALEQRLIESDLPTPGALRPQIGITDGKRAAVAEVLNEGGRFNPFAIAGPELRPEEWEDVGSRHAGGHH